MLRSRFAVATVVTAAAAVAVAVPSQAGAASGSVHLTKIYYDSPGVDRGSNASLNAEYVQINNSTAKSVSLKGWTLTDAANHRYVFSTYSLGAHKTVTVHTGKGANTAANRYWNSSWYIWNNDKDTATLKKASGAKVDTCSYNTTRFDYRNC